MKGFSLPATIFALIALTNLVNCEAVNVLVWDERQPRQAEAYDNFLGNVKSRCDLKLRIRTYN